jgi:sulfur-carrier protein
MRVQVLYFAGLRDVTGRAEEILDLGARGAGVPCTVADLAGLLSERYPALVPHQSSVRYAVNEQFAELGAAVQAGDVVALIPPVSGG